MSGDLRIFLRRQHADRNGARPGEIVANRIADRRVMLANPAGEDDQVRAAERDQHSGDMLGDRTAEDADRQRNDRVAGCSRGVELAQIRRNPRQPEQPTLWKDRWRQMEARNA